MKIESDLLDAIGDGRILFTISRMLETGNDTDRKQIEKTLVKMHNNGQFDFVACIKQLESDHFSDFELFELSRLFGAILPSLDTSTRDVMDCILQFDDAHKGKLFTSFTEYCSAEPARAREALELIESHPKPWIEFLLPTIAAGSRDEFELYSNRAILLANHEELEVRRKAVWALGTISYTGRSDLCDSAFSCLESIAEKEIDGKLLGNVVGSAIKLSEFKVSSRRLTSLVELALSRGDSASLRVASSSFAFDFERLPDELLETLLLHLLRVDPRDRSTIDNVDLGLSKLLKSKDPSRGISFLESLLMQNPDELSIDKLRDTTRAIYGGLLNRLTTRWFLRGEPVLCQNIYHLVQGVHAPIRLEIDQSELTTTESAQIYFVARKAIGYLSPLPESAASIIVSFLRRLDIDIETTEQLMSLLFNLLFINYPHTIKKYLEDELKNEADRTRKVLERVFKACETYLKDLTLDSPILELRPSQSQRESYHRNYSRIFSQSCKEAQKKSPLLSVLPKKVVLYGNSSIYYAYSEDGERQRREVPLTGYGTQFESPMLSSIDPIGAEYILAVFRAESR